MPNDAFSELLGLPTLFSGLVELMREARQVPGIKKVLIPEDNAKDLTEISDAIKGGMEIIPVARLDKVLPHVPADRVPALGTTPFAV